MSTAPLTISEVKNTLPVLIVDKTGIIGESLADKIKEESLVIFVSEKKPQDQNIVHIPFLRSIPSIPDNTYSHIFFVDESGELTRKLLEPFIKKINQDDSELILILNKDNFNQQYSSLIPSQQKIKTILTGDIFAANFIFDKRHTINKFIKEVIQEKRINIPGDGTSIEYPVFFEDVIYGILQTGFIEDNFGMFLLYPRQGFTLLSISRILQKIIPEVRINFSSEVKQISQEIALEGKSLLGESYELEEKLRKVQFSEHELNEIKRENGKKTNHKYKFPTNIVKIVSASFITFSVLLILPVVFSFLFLTTGNFFLANSNNYIEKGNLSSAKNNLNFSYYNFLFANANVTLLSKEASFIGLSEKTDNLSDRISKGQLLATNTLDLLSSIDRLSLLFFSGENLNKADFYQSMNDIKNSLVYFQSINSQFLNNNNLKNLSNFTATTIDSWPSILGFEGSKKYAVLLQDNNVLRSEGGVISYIFLVTINNGKLTSFKSIDANNLDSNLKGHIEPPFAIRRYEGKKNWYIQDSSYDVEFQKSAVAAATLILSELKQPVDGVIALDSEFLKNVVTEAGDVRLSNSLVINNKNFDTVLSSNKSSLDKIAIASFNKIANDKSISYLNLLKVFANSVFDKHINFAFNKPNTQGLFMVGGFSSSLFDGRVDQDTAINDFIGINEYSLANYPINSFISRSLSLSSSIDNLGKVNNVLKISYKNGASKQLLEKGVYKNYLRVIVPFGATLSKIEVDGVLQNILTPITDPNAYESKKFIPKAGLEVERIAQSGKYIFGFNVNTSPESFKNISVYYTLNKQIDFIKDDFSYSLRVYKQPGIDLLPLSFTLNLPSKLTFVSQPKEVQKPGIFADNLSQDKTYQFQISKK